MELTKREKRKLKLDKLRQQSSEVQQEHEARVERQKQLEGQSSSSSSKTKYYIIASVIAVIVLSIAAYSIYSMGKPGQYDNFAKCLAEKGAIMYGALDWCKYTQAQRAMFGNSFKYLNYHEFTELPGIKKTPTWVINGQWYENVQSFDKLSALTGCKV